jgi:hypothetical protein
MYSGAITMGRKLCLCIVLVLAVFSQTNAQQVAVKDAGALSVLRSSIASMGGLAAVGGVLDSTVVGTSQYGSGTDAPPPISFTWQTAGGEFQNTAQNQNGVYTVLSGHGSPAQLKHGNWLPLAPYVARATLPFHLPALVLLSELQNANYSIQYVGQETINGKPAIHVHIADNSDSIGQAVTAQDWYFDPTSQLPTQVDFLLLDEGNMQYSRHLSMAFASFQSASGIQIPYQITTTLNGTSTTATISTVTFNSGLPASTFNPPAGVSQ